MPDGRIAPRQVECLRKVGDWLKHYGESIYGTRGGPFVAPGEKNRKHRRGKENHFEMATGGWWGGSTHRENVAYLHILRWPSETIVLPRIGRRLKAHSVLTGGTAEVRETDQGLEVTVAPDQRHALDTIVKLEFDRSLAGILAVPGRPAPTGIPEGSLAQGCTATASGFWPNPRLTAGLAFDGDPETRWGGAPKTKSGWIEVDLGTVRTIGRVAICETHGRVRKFELQVMDGDSPQDFFSGNTIGPEFSADFKPVTARRIRLNISAADDVPTIWEIGFYPPK
jgi:alpha-L-fucosidase